MQKGFEDVLKNFQTLIIRLMQNLTELIQDLLASKEMYVGRYYFERKNGLPQ